MGKGADEYQRAYDDECHCKYRSGFRFHELPSAVIAYRLGSELGLTEDERDICFITVLQHVNAMRDWLACDLGREVETREWNFKDHGDVIRAFIKGQFGAEVKLDVSLREAIDLLDRSKRSLRERRSWGGLYCLLLAPLMVGDNLDASRSRGDLTPTRRWFVDELRASLT